MNIFVYFRDYSLKLVDHIVVFRKAMFTCVPLLVYRHRAINRIWLRLRGHLHPCSCFVQGFYEHCALDLFKYYTTHVVHDSLQMETKGGFSSSPSPCVRRLWCYPIWKETPFCVLPDLLSFYVSFCGICSVCWPRFNRIILPFSLDL